jgi:hypothetical protein
MIAERVLWFVSTLVDTRWLFMNEERKRMKALGGRGMWLFDLFCVWTDRRDGVEKESPEASRSSLANRHR